MMIAFAIGLVLLTGFALAFVIWPLLRPGANKNRSLLVGLLIGLPALALGFYWYSSSSQQLLQYWAKQQQVVAVDNELAHFKNPAAVVTKLEHFLREHPQQAKGWYLLGHIYLREQRYYAAWQVLQKAHKLKLANSDYAVAFVQASFLLHHQHLTSQQRGILLSVLQRNPQHVGALNLLAINAYRAKDYQAAIGYWERLLPLFSVDSQDEKVLLKMLGMAHKALEQTQIARKTQN